VDGGGARGGDFGIGSRRLPSSRRAVPRLARGAGGAVAEYERGPVLVTVEYRVPAVRAADFRATVGPLRAARLREGAIRWDLFQDVEDAERLVEVFLVESWLDHFVSTSG